MISKQKQIGVLRSLLIQELKKKRVKETMISTLKGNQNVGKGTLISALQRFDYQKAIRVSKTSFDKSTGLITYFELSYSVRLGSATYGLLLDDELHKEITRDEYARIKYSGRGNKIRKLMSWIRTKNPTTWRKPINIDLSKEYKVRKLAIAIANSNLSNPDRATDHKTNYLSKNIEDAEYAADAALVRFVDYWSDEFINQFEVGLFKANVF